LVAEDPAYAVFHAAHATLTFFFQDSYGHRSSPQQVVEKRHLPRYAHREAEAAHKKYASFLAISPACFQAFFNRLLTSFLRRTMDKKQEGTERNRLLPCRLSAPVVQNQ
jgi:hypothetical protein